MKLLTVDGLEEAGEKLLRCLKTRPLKTESVPLEKAQGRILGEDVFAPEDIPGFRRSTVDGYAVVSADTAAAGENIPVFLNLAGRVNMGEAAGAPVRRGECAYVPTGGMVPSGADAVVMVEYCEVFAGDSVAVSEAAAPLANVAGANEDAPQGGLLLCRGTRITPREAGVLAAAGVTQVPVYAPLTLAIISTGDELVGPECRPGAGQVRDVNAPALKAMSASQGFAVTQTRLIKDDEALFAETLRERMADSDAVIVSGGSSQGERDFTARVFAGLAKPGVLVHGLAIKPGKPTILAFDESTRTVLLGLPGHPVSAMMVFDMLFVRAARAYFGEPAPLPVPARISCNVASAPGRTTCQPVVLRRTGAGYVAEPVFGKSGMITSLTRASGYVVIDKNKEGLQKDEEVWVELF